MNLPIGSLSPDFAIEILGKYGFLRDDYLGMLSLVHRQQGEEEEEESESLSALVQNLQTQIENWQKQETSLFVSRPFLLSQMQKVLGHVSHLHEIRSKETLRLVDHHIERKYASVMRTVPSARGAGRQLSFHFYSFNRHEMEKRLIEQEIPVEYVRQLVHTLHEHRNIHQIERHLNQQGLSSHHVQQVVQILLHPQVLKKREKSTQRVVQTSQTQLSSEVLRETGATRHSVEQTLQTLLHPQVIREQGNLELQLERMLLQDSELRFNHREVEKRLLEQEIPVESIQQLLHTLHERRNIHQIERHLNQQGLSSHHVQQVVQTLLHPQVLKKREMSTERVVQTLQPTRLHTQVLRQYDTPSQLLKQSLQTLLHSQVHREQGAPSQLFDQTLQTLQRSHLLTEQGVPSQLFDQTWQTLQHSHLLTEQGAPSQLFNQTLQMLQHSRLFREQGASSQHLEQSLQRFLESPVLRVQAPSPHTSMNMFLHSQVINPMGASSSQPIWRVMRMLMQPQTFLLSQVIAERQQTLLQQNAFRFDHRDDVQHLLQTLQERRAFREVERQLTQHGLPIHQVQEILQTLLNPQVLTAQGLMLSHPQFRTHAQDKQQRESTLQFDHREVEKRLLKHGIPQIQQVLQTLHENSTFRQIERQLQKLGVQSHHVRQVFQTLLHPQVIRAQGVESQPIQLILQTILHPQVLTNLQNSLLQKTELRFDHREVVSQLTKQGLPSQLIQQVLQTLLHPQMLKAQPVQQFLPPQIHTNLRETLLQETALRFNQRELERTVIDQEIPLQLHRTANKLDTNLSQQNLSNQQQQQQVQQQLQTILHPQARTVDRVPIQQRLQTVVYPQEENALLRATALHFNHREVEKRLLRQAIPVEHIEQVLQTLNPSTTFRQIEKHLTQKGLPIQTVQQVMKTLLHPRVLHFTTDRTESMERTLLQQNTLLFNHREVEKRLLDQSIPTEQIQQVLRSLNETSTFRHIEKRLTQQGLPSHRIHQVLQTLLHPQVHQRQQPQSTWSDRTLLQTAQLLFDHRVPIQLRPDSAATLTQTERAIQEATQIHRFSNTTSADEPFSSESLAQRRDLTYGGQAPIELFRPKPADPPPPPAAPAVQPAPPVEVEQKLKLDNIAPDDLQRFIDRIYREIEKRTKLERSLRGL